MKRKRLEKFFLEKFYGTNVLHDNKKWKQNTNALLKIKKTINVIYYIVTRLNREAKIEELVNYSSYLRHV